MPMSFLLNPLVSATCIYSLQPPLHRLDGLPDALGIAEYRSAVIALRSARQGVRHLGSRLSTTCTVRPFFATSITD